MNNSQGIHLKIFSAFCSHYHDLKKEGKISQQQLEEVSELLDNLEKYSYEEVKNKLEEIFPDYEAQELPRYYFSRQQ